MLHPISVEGRWGFINDAGTVVISPQFLSANRFLEGLPRVSVPGLTEEDQYFERNASGFIDERGDFVIGPGVPPGYQFPESSSHFYSYDDFHHGMARFWVGDATGCGGYIDRAGALVIAPKFPSAGHFSDGLACVACRERMAHRSGPKLRPSSIARASL